MPPPTLFQVPFPVRDADLVERAENAPTKQRRHARDAVDVNVVEY